MASAVEGMTSVPIVIGEDRFDRIKLLMLHLKECDSKDETPRHWLRLELNECYRQLLSPSRRKMFEEITKTSWQEASEETPTERLLTFSKSSANRLSTESIISRSIEKNERDQLQVTKTIFYECQDETGERKLPCRQKSRRNWRAKTSLSARKRR